MATLQKKIFFMTNRQSGKEQIPSVTGNLAQMIVWVNGYEYVSEWVKGNNSMKIMGGKITSKT